MPPKSIISNMDLSPKLQICNSFLPGDPITTSSQLNDPKMESIHVPHSPKLACIPGTYSLREVTRKKPKEQTIGRSIDLTG